MVQWDSIKDQIRLRVDLVEVIGEHVELKRAGRELRGLCPFHNEKTPSFYVNPDKGFFRCHGCSAGGDLFKFVQLREGVTFIEALRLLADRAGIDVEALLERRTASGAQKLDLYRVNEWAVEFFRRQLSDEVRGAPVRAYIEKRGISPEIRDCFYLGFAPDDPTALQRAARAANLPQALLLAADLIRRSDHGGYYDTFRNRLMFPIRDVTRRCIGFGGRALGDAPAKYLNTSQNTVFDKGSTLFGLDQARQAIGQTRTAVLVEGYTDCLAAHQHGFKNTIATLGTAASEQHFQTLRRYADVLILLFDSDAAGEAAADRALGVALQHGLTVKIARVPSGKDPSEFLQSGSAETFAHLLNSATEALAFKWARTCSRYAAGEGGRVRREVLLEFIDLVASAARFGAVDPIQRGLISNQVAQLLALPSEDVHAMLLRATSTAARRRTPSDSSADSAPAGTQDALGSIDAEQSALTTVMEVLLNEPWLVGLAEGVFDPALFGDPQMGDLAQRIWSLCRCFAWDERSEEKQLGIVERVLADVENPTTAGTIAALADAGSRIANREDVLRGAIERLRRLAAKKQALALTEPWSRGGVPSASGPDADDTAVAARLAEITHRLSANAAQETGAFGPARIPASWR